MDDSLRGVTAIVTGASRNIGRAISDALGGQGARIALLARSEKALVEAAHYIDKAGGEGVVFPCDLTDPQSIETTINHVRDRLGAIDILVNNAGVFLEKPIDEIALHEWEDLFKVNLTAPFLLFRQVLPIMKNQGGGKIINIASTASTKGYMGQSAYAASKHGLLGLARCLAIEGRPHNIHVYTICAGAVRTDLIQGTFLESRLQGQNLIEVGDIAGLVVFLLKQPENIDLSEIVLNRFATG